MNIREAYREWEFRLNKLGTNAGQRIGLPQFVASVNKAQAHWAEARARASERDGIIVDELRPILKEFEVQGQNMGKFYRVALPEDYFHIVRAETTTDCGIMYVRRTEEGNLNTLLPDPYSSPSPEWEETLGTIFGNDLRVYTTGFKIGNVTVRYYRHPVRVDIEGYQNGTLPSTDIDLEFNGASAYEILDIAALIASSDTGDQARWQSLTQLIQANP